MPDGTRAAVITAWLGDGSPRAGCLARAGAPNLPGFFGRGPLAGAEASHGPGEATTPLRLAVAGVPFRMCDYPVVGVSAPRGVRRRVYWLVRGAWAGSRSC